MRLGSWLVESARHLFADKATGLSIPYFREYCRSWGKFLATAILGGRMPPWGKKKSLHSPAYDRFLDLLRQMRVDAGLTQRQLGEKIGRAHGYVSKTELGERRLDMVEFIEYCDGCAVDPAKFIQRFRRNDTHTV